MSHRILFVDTSDAARGPMAESLAKAYGLDAESAGTMPAREVRRAAEVAMARIGLHIYQHRPHWVDLHHMFGGFQRIIALGDDVEESNPDLHIGEHWHIPDAQDGSLEQHERVRDAILQEVRALALEERQWT